MTSYSLPPEFGVERDCCSTITSQDHTSRCAERERAVLEAAARVGLPLTVLDEAAQAVDERGDAYGPPDENHGRTAIMFNAYTLAKYGRRIYAFDEEDICWFNVLQKMSRDMNAPSRDSLVDVCGFVRNIEILRG